MKFLFVCAFFAVPTILAAECPIATDLENGIALSVQGGDKEVFQPIGPSVIQSTYIAKDGYQSRALLAQGIYMIELINTKDGDYDPQSRITFSFPLKPVEMPAPEPRLQWNAEIVKLESGRIETSLLQHVFGDIGKITFGKCSYQMIPVELHLDTEDNAIDVLHYLPELGISYLAASTYGSNEERKTDRYVYFEIEAIN